MINFLEKCLILAKKGQGNVAPNPMVGAILMHDGKIIGEGYHAAFRKPHAEVGAINDAIENGHSDLISKSTLYINLEPCCHHGKTPPCTDLIIKHGIKKVVIAMKDPNPKVSGSGIRKLKEANIEVELIDLLEAEELNKIFIKNITTALPYVHLKVALTTDNKLTVQKGTRTKLTTEEEDKQVHELRNQYDGILVGRNTIQIDNPKLTCRLPEGKNPIRIILDSKASLLTEENFKHLNIFLEKGENLIAITKESSIQLPKNTRILLCKENKNGQIDLKSLLHLLFQEGIFSILVEGGYEVIQSFFKENLIDEKTLFKSEIASLDTDLPTISL
ncbi:bifunctional diaminohydroxyphosphoribosylaminopyrimidine deaminase/5-amino-6-(5-phosphoribosylamino)uracil reductase RibD [Candidatus Peregrinibacteria bacterium]|jgi:diaminohydroxyphosphoribosylaminopyrimidine deaminase / 5-amino-6-(5-phosphoribosylamino)uracil reductase|nr:bifunctional diaminohydroxyphosphoribosylaminopyrimidine deaminase/5-amino-6-(5-phosphoribosylamino)uracil reductase RibD [Candidatus Peregrinibacteria bacterium]